MAATDLVQSRIDPAIKDAAAAVLAEVGLTVSDAVRILLTRTAREGAVPVELLTTATAHDVWFRRQVQAALDDPRPDTPHAEAAARFAALRAGR
jgi:DNA-damage-inducible protein J